MVNKILIKLNVENTYNIRYRVGVLNKINITQHNITIKAKNQQYLFRKQPNSTQNYKIKQIKTLKKKKYH